MWLWLLCEKLEFWTWSQLERVYNFHAEIMCAFYMKPPNFLTKNTYVLGNSRILYLYLSNKQSI